MLKKLSVFILLFTFSSNVIAAKPKKVFGKYTSSLTEKGITTDMTCVDEIQTRKKQLIFGAATSPVVSGAVGAGGVYGAAALLATTGSLGATIVGIVLGVYTGGAAVIGYTAYKTIASTNMASLQKIVVQARLKEGKAFRKFGINILRRLRKPMTEENLESVRTLLVDMDSSSLLCNSKLRLENRQRRFLQNGRIKNAVAVKKEVRNYILSNL